MFFKPAPSSASRVFAMMSSSVSCSLIIFDPGIIKSSPSARNNYTNSFQKVVKCGIIENAFAAAEDRATLGSDSSAGADLNKGENPKTEAEIALWKTKAINPFRKLFRKVPQTIS